VAKNAKSEPANAMEKLARVVAIGVTKDMDKEEAARRLLGAGFVAATIGGILGVNANFANVAKARGAKKGKD
jgi:hydrogenase/urease accessory protein HupE